MESARSKPRSRRPVLPPVRPRPWTQGGGPGAGDSKYRKSRVAPATQQHYVERARANWRNATFKVWTAVVNKKEVPEVTSQGTPAAPQCVARSPRKTSVDYTTHVHPRGHLVTYVDNHRFGNDANKHQMAFSCLKDPPIRQRRRSNTLPNLPALVGLVMLRNLYNDENDENVPFPEQHEPMEITTLSEEPESAAIPDAGRFASALSRQAQCAILKGYDDMLMDNLSRLKPGCKRYLPKTDTPNLQMFCSPEMEQTRKQTTPVLPKIQRAMEILDGLKKAQGQPITSTTSKGLHNPVRQYRSWRSSWTA